MFDKLYVWIGKHLIALFVTALVITLTMTVVNLIDVVRKPASINVAEGSIQHRLVWSTKGECFFVRPYSNETVYLIRVQDCDKTEKVGK